MSKITLQQTPQAQIPTPLSARKTMFLDIDNLFKTIDPLGNVVPMERALTGSAPQPLGTASPGTVDFASRGDHVHAHGELGGGDLHALASDTEAGFMSAADKMKLDAIGGADEPDATDTQDIPYTGIDNTAVGTVFASVDDLNALRAAYSDLCAKYNALLANLRGQEII